jgi:hypothetical protein
MIGPGPGAPLMPAPELTLRTSGITWRTEGYGGPDSDVRAPSPTPADNTALAPTTRGPGTTPQARQPAIITLQTRSPVSAENAARNLKITEDRG